MKYKIVPPSLEFELIIRVRSLGAAELNKFYYDGQFAWPATPVKVKKYRTKITVSEISGGDNDNNAIH